MVGYEPHQLPANHDRMPLATCCQVVLLRDDTHKRMVGIAPRMQGSTYMKHPSDTSAARPVNSLESSALVTPSTATLRTNHGGSGGGGCGSNPTVLL